MQILGPLPPTWGTRIDFRITPVSLAQPQLLGHLGREPAVEDLCVSIHLCLSPFQNISKHKKKNCMPKVECQSIPEWPSQLRRQMDCMWAAWPREGDGIKESRGPRGGQEREPAFWPAVGEAELGSWLFQNLRRAFRARQVGESRTVRPAREPVP